MQFIIHFTGSTHFMAIKLVVVSYHKKVQLKRPETKKSIYAKNIDRANSPKGEYTIPNVLSILITCVFHFRH